MSAEGIGSEIISAMDGEFHDSPDRVIAIIGGAYLDEMLNRLFRAKRPRRRLNAKGDGWLAGFRGPVVVCWKYTVFTHYPRLECNVFQLVCLSHENLAK